jgi:hypothetical protein
MTVRLDDIWWPPVGLDAERKISLFVERRTEQLGRVLGPLGDALGGVTRAPERDPEREGTDGKQLLPLERERAARSD